MNKCEQLHNMYIPFIQKHQFQIFNNYWWIAFQVGYVNTYLLLKTHVNKWSDITTTLFIAARKHIEIDKHNFQLLEIFKWNWKQCTSILCTKTVPNYFLLHLWPTPKSTSSLAQSQSRAAAPTGITNTPLSKGQADHKNI